MCYVGAAIKMNSGCFCTAIRPRSGLLVELKTFRILGPKIGDHVLLGLEVEILDERF